MNRYIAAGAFVAAALLSSGGLLAADDIKSGPQVGENGRPAAFTPLNINGPTPGQKQCLVWRNGNNPVVMIFAREVSDGLVSLIKQVDKATVDNKAAKMGSFAVFLSDDDKLEDSLKELAKKEDIKLFTLSIDNPAGPAPYKIAKEADVTVVLYTKSKVVANYAYKSGKSGLSESEIKKIIADVPKILP